LPFRFLHIITIVWPNHVHTDGYRKITSLSNRTKAAKSVYLYTRRTYIYITAGSVLVVVPDARGVGDGARMGYTNAK